MKDPKILISIAGTPVLQAILKYVGWLKLVPLADWAWNADIVAPITYIVATGTAGLAYLLPVKTNRTKVILLGVGILTIIISLGAYTWVSTLPPKRGDLLVYDLVGYVAFFLTYISFGFLVTFVVKLFSKK